MSQTNFPSNIILYLLASGSKPAISAHTDSSRTSRIYGTPFATNLCHLTGAYKFHSLIIDRKFDSLINSLKIGFCNRS